LGAKQLFKEFLNEQAKAQRLPMDRFGTAEEFANIACFLTQS
jgi:NAD(P)-dependent dehydrogenase (short-subunit alcohol dehydrogenase family)